MEYAVVTADCIPSQAPVYVQPQNPNHYTSVISAAPYNPGRATSTRYNNGRRPLTSFNHIARGVNPFVPNYSTSLPDYLKNWYVDYYGAIVPLACSCIITSASADVVTTVTTTQVFSVYIVVSLPYELEDGEPANLGQSVLVMSRSATPIGIDIVTPYLTTVYMTVA